MIKPEASKSLLLFQSFDFFRLSDGLINQEIIIMKYPQGSHSGRLSGADRGEQA